MAVIYKITNIVNGKSYVGQTVQKVETRWRIHKWKLENKKHSNTILQNAWNKYGTKNFKFEVIEECETYELNNKEIYWINKSNSHYSNGGYNIKGGGHTIHQHDKITKDKISQKMKGRVIKQSWIDKRLQTMGEYNLTEEHKQKISKSNKENVPWNKGIKTKPETIQKQKESLKNFYSSDKGLLVREKISKTNKGRIVSKETRKKISDANIGKKRTLKQIEKIKEKRKLQDMSHLNKSVLCIETGVVYKSLKQAGKEMNIKPHYISRVCSKLRNQTNGYTFKYYKGDKNE